MEKYHDYTEAEKEAWFGNGEWVKEPDRVIFDHEGIHCIIRRVMKMEHSGHAFGGHLCGYCVLPENHPWIDKEWHEMGAKVHWGITYAAMGNDGKYMIGFDCAHSGDILPSMQQLRNSYRPKEELLKALNGPIPSFMKETYRSIDFVIEECKSLATQVKAAKCDT